MIQIKNRYDGSILFSSKKSKTLKEAVLEAIKLNIKLCYANLYNVNLSNANLSNANLSNANLSNANLSNANLSNADLSHADLDNADLSYVSLNNADLSYAYVCYTNLSYADLNNADLKSANLDSVNLHDANLRNVRGVDKYVTTPLCFLLDQVGKIRMYKLVRGDNKGPWYPTVPYEVGKTYEVANANTDETIHCAQGIGLATLDWCLRKAKVIRGAKILIAEFTKKDIAAIPIGSDGKFRVFRCKIVKEWKSKD